MVSVLRLWINKRKDLKSQSRGVKEIKRAHWLRNVELVSFAAIGFSVESVTDGRYRHRNPGLIEDGRSSRPNRS